ncbi:lantibiotic dehydratase [Micromonospora sp. NPDC051141]|uniref:lantibiotic dehydratase n=1 Tax=Micromonospora sp. NPDC051141 TaxID=3364284 RepID=UPI00379B6BEB
MLSPVGAALIRVAAYPNDLVLPALPDLIAGQPEQWRQWLSTAWALPGFATAVASATPGLARQVAEILAGEPTSPHRLRRLVEAAVRYLLRWTSRATPFGTFAGIAPVDFGTHASVRWGEEHQVVSRPDGQFIAEHTTRAEQDLRTLRDVAVVTNSLGYRRDGRWVLPCARADADRRWDVEIRLTQPMRAALRAAQSPVMFAELAAMIAGPTGAGTDAAERLLASLVRTGVLLSALRPAMTVTDPAAHLASHVPMPDAGSRVAVDLRVDVSVTLPPAVLHEAGRAASTLTAVAPLMPAWTEYHRAFIQRWGPGVAVPLRDVLNVLGFPTGYRGSTRRMPPVFGTRDRLLAQLAQQSALDDCAEVILDDELIGRLRGDDDRPPIPHTELRFTLAAATAQDLDRGAFTLTVVSGARHAGVSASRFLHLLTEAELASFQRVYRNLPTALSNADTVQLSGPPLEARLAPVARTPELLPVLPVGDFYPDPPRTVNDLAVTGDGQRLWLVSQTSGQPVEPLLLNSVLLPGLQQPLMRFLTEIWTAWTAPCSRFDWGHASGLPFLPRVRRGHSVVHPARWIIDQSALPRTTSWPRWRDAWQRYRTQHRLPDEVLIGDDDVQLRLHLDDTTHLAVLRRHLERHDRTVMIEAPGTAGWIGGRPAELLITLASTTPAVRPSRPVRAATALQHRPGQPPWLEVRLHGHLDDILADLARRADTLLTPGWWFLRYPDPEPHLRLRIPADGPDGYTATTARLARWAQHLDDDGVLNDYSLHTYRPEARHGTGPALAAAEAVFAADSAATLHRLTGDRQATTAASTIAIADSFTSGHGKQWLATHVPHRSGPRLDPTQLALARIPYRDDNLNAALAAYRTLAHTDNLDLDQVLADLLHLHHARMIGVDTASERHCLRLARTIARAAEATS